MAIGAALYAHSLEDDTNLKLQLLDVIPMAIGLEKAGGALPRRLPAQRADPQRQADPGHHQLRQPDRAGHAHLPGRPRAGGARTSCSASSPSPASAPAAAGEVQVEITFDVNVEGILTMSAHDPATGREMKTTVRVTQS